MYWKSPGRGITKYKMHRQRLYHLCCLEVNVGEVFVHCKQKQGRTRRQYCSPVDIKMKCVYNYYVQSCVFYVSIPFPPIYNQSIPIYLSIDIDNRYQSITTRIFAIDWSSIININRLIDIDWYWLISIGISYRFYRLDTPGFLSRYHGYHIFFGCFVIADRPYFEKAIYLYRDVGFFYHFVELRPDRLSMLSVSMLMFSLGFRELSCDGIRCIKKCNNNTFRF